MLPCELHLSLLVIEGTCLTWLSSIITGMNKGKWMNSFLTASWMSLDHIWHMKMVFSLYLLSLLIIPFSVTSYHGSLLELFVFGPKRFQKCFHTGHQCCIMVSILGGNKFDFTPSKNKHDSKDMSTCMRVETLLMLFIMNKYSYSIKTEWG